MTELTMMSCGECGVDFSMPTALFQECKKLGGSKSWYCPNGHSRCFRESDIDKMRRERDCAIQEQARLAEQITLKEREIKRIKKRASAGVCQCCNRTFANMSRHMKTKHPEVFGENIKKMRA